MSNTICWPRTLAKNGLRELLASSLVDNKGEDEDWSRPLCLVKGDEDLLLFDRVSKVVHIKVSLVGLYIYTY